MKKVKKVEIDYNVDEIDLEPGQSILSNIVEQEVRVVMRELIFQQTFQ